MKEAKLQQIALNVLAKREHCRYELRQKLKRHSENDFLIERVLQFLEEHCYLSEERFVETFVRSKMNRGYGPYWIQHALTNKKINQQLIQLYLHENIDWLKATQIAYFKKYGDTKPKELSERAKRWRFLQNRGFLREHILDCLKD